MSSLRTKFLWGSVLVIVLVMSAVFAVVEHRQSRAIVDQLKARGRVLSRNLAAMASGHLLLYNFTGLEQDVAHIAREMDVLYALVLDGEGNVAAHSRRPEQVGRPLGEAVDRRAREAGGPIVQDARDPATGEALYDFSVPVLVDQHRWGTVRVGLSKRRMNAEIRRTRLELGALTAVTVVLGGVAAALVARRIARPVQRLADGVAAVSRGELDHRIEPTTLDEIGRLAVAFNHMAAQLGQQRHALEAAHAELRQRFEELADLKSYTDNILASVKTGIVTVDLEGRVVTLNPAAELLTGFFAGEAAGRYCTEVFRDSPVIGEILMEALATRADAPGVPVALTRRNGTPVPVEFSVAPLKGGDGKDLGVVGVVRDLTLVRELQRQLERSDRLAAVGTLAAGLAHEIKNPLTSLLTFTRHLTRRFDDPGFRDKFQRIVPRELERINAIVERLLELSRPAHLTPSPVLVPALLDRAAELFTDRLDSQGVRVSREYAATVVPVEADEELLYRAFVNLVANALDAMADGGRLSLRVGWSHERDADLGARRAGRGGPRVRVEIADTGTGMTADAVDRIFNPFFTTKEHGTGLGLALTHKIIEDHGGSIMVSSALGMGTTFRILLPLVPPRPAPSRELR
jgi:two-component system sensor histidine kinase AtoS